MLYREIVRLQVRAGLRCRRGSCSVSSDRSVARTGATAPLSGAHHKLVGFDAQGDRLGDVVGRTFLPDPHRLLLAVRELGMVAFLQGAGRVEVVEVLGACERQPHLPGFGRC